MRSGSRGAARRYARALLDVALPAGEDAAVAQGLQEADALLRGHEDLRTILLHPAVASERKRAITERVFQGLSSPLLKRLLQMLASRERMELLGQIARVYVDLWNAQRGVVTAEVEAAVALTGEQEARLAAALGRAAGGRKVELQSRLDPQLLGGVLVRMEGRVYDASVRGRLRALRRHLLGREVA